MNKIYKKYLLSPEWASVTNDLYLLRGRKCCRCGSDKNLNIHHLNYDNIFKEEPGDLEILCKDCHNTAHGIIKNKKGKYVKKKSTAKITLAMKVIRKKKKKKKAYRL